MAQPAAFTKKLDRIMKDLDLLGWQLRKPGCTTEHQIIGNFIHSAYAALQSAREEAAK